MEYNDFRYLWPPRPTEAIQSLMFPIYEGKKWVAQVKMNGTCSVIFVKPDKELIAWSRHNGPHKAWAPTEGSSAIFKTLPGKGWYVIVAELMHSKVPGLRDTNYINDILVADGKYLVGSTFAERQELLKTLFLHEDKGDISHYVVDKHTWLAKNHSGDFGELFNSLDKPEHEGLVLKDPKAKLNMCERKEANCKWMVKHRRPTKNYGF